MLPLALLLAGPAYDTTTVRVTAAPPTVWIEEVEGGRSVSLDLLIQNPTAAPLDVDEVQLSVYDRAGEVVLRRVVDGSGTRPAIRTLDVPEVPAGGTALVFNPFPVFGSDLDLARLVYDVKLSGKSGAPLYAARLEVKPQPQVPQMPLILPAAGRLLVWDGHDLLAHHRRWDTTIPGLQQLGFHTNFGRYSYDLVPVDEKGEMAHGDEGANESFPGFGHPVRATADGTVAAVVDTRPDDRRFDPSAMGADTMQIWGNYVVIDHGNGAFSLYGHVRQGSARVTVGQKVKAGDPVAAIGASGSARFPHLHYELQTGPGTDAEGLPSTFVRFDRVRGAQRIAVERGAIASGEFVQGR